MHDNNELRRMPQVGRAMRAIQWDRCMSQKRRVRRALRLLRLLGSHGVQVGRALRAIRWDIMNESPKEARGTRLSGRLARQRDMDFHRIPRYVHPPFLILRHQLVLQELPNVRMDIAVVALQAFSQSVDGQWSGLF